MKIINILTLVIVLLTCNNVSAESPSIQCEKINSTSIDNKIIPVISTPQSDLDLVERKGV